MQIGSETVAIILAAGKGTRMLSERAKVLHEVAGISMLGHVLHQTHQANIERIIVVIGHQHEQVRSEASKHNAKVQFAMQSLQLGTGHAIMQAKDQLEQMKPNKVVILSGDVPLLQSTTIESIIHLLDANKVDGVVLTAIVDDPYGLGRIVRNPTTNCIERIVEQKDCSGLAEENIQEINSGVYVFRWTALCSVLNKIDNNNAQKEYYLTDAIRLLLESGHKIICKQLSKTENYQITGVNTIQQLELVEQQYKNMYKNNSF